MRKSPDYRKGDQLRPQKVKSIYGKKAYNVGEFRTLTEMFVPYKNTECHANRHIKPISGSLFEKEQKIDTDEDPREKEKNFEEQECRKITIRWANILRQCDTTEYANNQSPIDNFSNFYFKKFVFKKLKATHR